MVRVIGSVLSTVGWGPVNFGLILLLIIGGAVMLIELRTLLRRAATLSEHASAQATLAADRANKADAAAVAAEGQTRKTKHAVANLDAAVRVAFRLPDGAPAPLDGGDGFHIDEDLASR